MQTGMTLSCTFYDSVKESFVIIAFQAQLHKVSHCQRSLFGPQLHFDFSHASDQHHLSFGGRFQVVYVGHSLHHSR